MQHNPQRAAATLALIVVVAVAAGCGGNGSDNTAEPTAAVKQHYPPGNPAVWNRIWTGTDCQALYDEWARDTDKATPLSLDYADAAWQQMRDIGCYAAGG